MLRIAINGYGRIGRNILRSIFERGLHTKLQIVAINDLGDAKTLAHLTRFDSTFGRFAHAVQLCENNLIIGEQSIRLLNQADPAQLPWQALEVDVVLECTGRMKQRAQAAQHLSAGANRVLLAHPMDSADLTVVYGINHHLAPLAKVLHEAVGIQQGMMTTIHAYTNDQNLLDKNHKDLYRARAAASSIIPTSTGAAKAIGLVIPELAGRLDGMAVRVPTQNVSLVDLSFIAERETSQAEINSILSQGAAQLAAGVMECNEQPLVSCDFNGHPVSCIADLTQTRVQGNLVKVLAWYDNEWAFSNRMLDVVMAWHNPK